MTLPKLSNREVEVKNPEMHTYFDDFMIQLTDFSINDNEAKKRPILSGTPEFKRPHPKLRK